MGHYSQRSHERRTEPQPRGGTRLVVTEASSITVKPVVELGPEEWRDIDTEQTPEATTVEYDQYVNFDASGLAQLRQHLLETLADARSCETEFLAPAAAGEIDTARLDEYLAQLTEAYEVLQTMLRQAEAQLEDASVGQAEYVSGNDIQEHYDAFMRRYDRVVAEVKALNESLDDTADPIPNALDEVETTTDSLPPSVPANDNRPPAERTPQPDISSESLPQTFAVFVTETHRLFTKYQHALSVWETTFASDQSSEVTIFLDEYQHSLDRLKHIYDVTRTVDQDDDAKVTVAQLEIYERVRHEAEANITTLESALVAYQAGLDTTKDTSHKPENESDKPTSPDMDAVERLKERIKSNVTVTDDVKQIGLTMLANYERLLQEGAEPLRLAESYEPIKSFLDGILDNKVGDLQTEFTKKYQQLIKIPNLTSDQAETLLAMKTQFDRQMTMTPVAIESLQKTFDNLKQYESDHPVELVRLFGMRLPPVGSQGVFGARSFREALELQLHDARIKANPEAKDVLKKILKVVGFVPEEGLTADEVSQLQQLATRLNQMVETTRTPEEYVVPDVLVTIPHKGESGDSTLTLELSKITIKPSPVSIPQTKIMSVIQSAATAQLLAKPYSTSEEVSEVVSRELSSVANRALTVNVGELTLVLHNPQTSKEAVAPVEAVPPVNDTTTVMATTAPESAVLERVSASEIADELPSILSSSVDDLSGVYDHTSTVTSTETDQSIDTVLEPKKLLDVLTTMTEEKAGQFMHHPKIEQVIQEWYGPVSVFEKKVRRQAVALEEKNYDWLERKTSEFKSMYEYLEGMSVRDIEILRHRNRDELRRTLSERGLKYEALTSNEGWYEMLLQMQDVLPYRETTTFADLWQRWCLYLEVKRRVGSSG